MFFTSVLPFFHHRITSGIEFYSYIGMVPLNSYIHERRVITHKSKLSLPFFLYNIQKISFCQTIQVLPLFLTQNTHKIVGESHVLLDKLHQYECLPHFLYDSTHDYSVT